MSTLTKKHYEAISRTLVQYRAQDNDGEYITDMIASDLADYFTQDNPKFNRARFLQACGVDKK